MCFIQPIIIRFKGFLSVYFIVTELCKFPKSWHFLCILSFWSFERSCTLLWKCFRRFGRVKLSGTMKLIDEYHSNIIFQRVHCVAQSHHWITPSGNPSILILHHKYTSRSPSFWLSWWVTTVTIGTKPLSHFVNLTLGYLFFFKTLVL